MTARRLGALAWTTGLVLVAAATSTPQAGAWWSRVAPRRSATAPFTVCAPSPRSVRCTLIEDPTRGTRTRGPLPPGAITRGPQQEVSPALTGHGEEGGYSPEDLRTAYDLSAVGTGIGQTVAVVEAYDDPAAEADVAEYRREYGLSSCSAEGGCFRKVNQRGGKSLPSPNGEWAKEESIDIDMVSAICPNCHILVVEAETAESQNIAIAEDEAVALGATEISDSFAQPTPLESQEAAAYDHPGIPIAVSAGDEGYGVVWPAANPHVIAVGGTTLEPPSGHGPWTETAWSKTSGGCSTETKPPWQSDACAGRTANDVAAVADPNTPVSAYDSFETHGSPWLLAGGTSVAAPIIAAAMALASPYTRSFDGAQGLYLEHANGIDGFYNVLSGSTGNCGSYLCEAGPGYNGPTGLGGLRGAPEVPAPAPVTLGASVASREVTLEGTVNPHGASVTCVFEYGQSSYSEASRPCSPQPGAVFKSVDVSATLSALTPGASYQYRVALSYSGGSAAGEVLSFTVPSEQPSVLSQSASSLSPTSEELGAMIDPGGAAVEACWFEYGETSPGYGSFAYCTTHPGAGNSAVAVSASAARLRPGTTYHFRAYVRTGPGHEVLGADQTFTTPVLAPTPTTLPASAIGPESATLNASVDPNGDATSCEFEFGSGTRFVPCSVEPGSGESPVAVSATVGGLSPSTRYLYRVVATNAGGTVYGAIDELVTASAPPQPAPPEAPTTPLGTSSLTEAPLSQPGPQADQSSGTAACVAHLASTVLLASRTGIVKLPVRCTRASASGHGTVTLLASNSAGTRSRSSSRTDAPLARAAFALPAAGATTVVLHLSAQARRLLVREHILHAIAVIVTRPPLGAFTSSAAVTLRARTGPRR